MEAQDKRLIWEDCPACAYKHLTAAYAALTALTALQDGDFDTPSETDVFLGRAVIALREAEAGYEGNRDLAAGCLAMAETCPERHKAYKRPVRHLRLSLQNPDCDLPGVIRLVVGMFSGDPVVMAHAHVAEARRELPGLPGQLPDAGLRDWLRQSILWVKETYELGGRDEAKA